MLDETYPVAGNTAVTMNILKKQFMMFQTEVLVSDGGTLIVDEDASLGTPDATLRLSEGGLRIAGKQMGELGRNVSLEGAGGFIEIASANDACHHLRGDFRGWCLNRSLK